MTPRKPRAETERKAEPSGLCCRACGSRELRVIYTRNAPLKRVMRRRECRRCGKRTTTYEEEGR